MGNFSLDAANSASRAARLADENGNMIVKVAEMVSLNKRAIDDMRNWQAGRFNNLVDGFHKLYARFDAQDREIQDLKAQVAGLQRRLYEQEKKKAQYRHD